MASGLAGLALAGIPTVVADLGGWGPVPYYRLTLPSSPPVKQRFSVDIAGLLEALTEQFPEPLLCVRELVQNAADAAAQRIEVDVSFDARRSLFRLSVRDDGRGMNADEVEGYLTIGFSEKDPSKDRGRFGVGKLSPYALDIVRMQVETCDGEDAHRLLFNKDGSGTITRTDLKPRGTVVRVYKACEREEAEALAERAFALVDESCGSIGIPLFVNGNRVNREIALATPYALTFADGDTEGVLGIAAEPTRLLMGGGIVLETGAPILGNELSYILDSPRLSPTLSRNAVRRDKAFEASLRAAQGHLPSFIAHAARELRAKVRRLAQDGRPVERELDPNDRATMEWLRTTLLEPEGDPPDSVVRAAPVLETADGNLVSADELVDVIRREGRLPSSRVPLTRDEISAYADRGVPVLLLYRDLEDFIERQGIPTVEVDGQDDGVEIAPGNWSPGEIALADRPELPKRRPPVFKISAAAFGVTAALALGVLVATTGWPPRVPGIEPATQVAVARSPDPGVAVERSAGPSLEPAPTASVAIASVATPRASPTQTRSLRALLLSLAGIIAVLSAAAGLAMLYFSTGQQRPTPASWLREEAGTPLVVGEGSRRRADVLRRAVFHPIDFFVARGWSIRAAGQRSLSASSSIKGYRELSPEPHIRSGVRLDLDRVEIGFVDLVSSVGEPHDGRILLVRGQRVLLNRNHPTVRDLITVAGVDAPRARVLLDVLLATDPELARGTDPRQVEWDLLRRAEQSLTVRRS